jgi:predicted RNA-binding protein with PUA domain
MRNLSRSILVFCVLLCGCTAGRALPAGAADVPAKGALITMQEVRDTRAQNVYDVIQFLRPSWLQQRGPSTFGAEGGVAVYLNRIRLPGVEALREIESGAVTYIRYFDPMAAQFRFGLSNVQGAIQVVTERADR